MKEILSQYVAYNYWANQRILDFILGLPEDLLNKEVPSSFKSLKKTVLHIWDAEMIWISRLKGKSMSYWPSQQIGENETIAGLLDVSAEWIGFLKDKDKNYFNLDCFYKSIAGKEYSQKIYMVVMHCMNHSSFHRGQVVTILRGLGIKEGIPETDMIAFDRSRS